MDPFGSLSLMGPCGSVLKRFVCFFQRSITFQFLVQLQLPTHRKLFLYDTISCFELFYFFVIMKSLSTPNELLIVVFVFPSSTLEVNMPVTFLRDRY